MSGRTAKLLRKVYGQRWPERFRMVKRNYTKKTVAEKREIREGLSLHLILVKEIDRGG